MMQNPIHLFLLGLIVCTTGFNISSNCVNQCKIESSIKCEKPCNFNMSAISSVTLIYGHQVIDTCTKICRCDEHEYVYPRDKICKIIHSFADVIGSENCDCMRRLRIWHNDSIKRKILNPGEWVKRYHMVNYLMYGKVGSLIENVQPGNVESTTNPWENWCKRKCADGLGGSACYCDILP